VTEVEAMECLGVLTGTTTGWTDEAVLNYCHDLMAFDDVEVLRRAVGGLARSWGEARRPPLVEVRSAYARELERKQDRLRVATLPTYRNAVAPRDGVEVARSAYEMECGRLGRVVNMDYFDRVMSGLLE